MLRRRAIGFALALSAFAGASDTTFEPLLPRNATRAVLAQTVWDAPKSRIAFGPYVSAANLGGRRLEARGFELSAESTMWRAWFRREKLYARGLVNSDGTANRFDANNSSFGAEAAINGNRTAGLVVRYEGHRPGNGVSDNERGTVVRFAAPTVDALFVSRGFGEGWRAEVGYGRVKTGAATVNAVSASASKTKSFGDKVEAVGTGFLGYDASPGDKGVRGFLAATLRYRPNSWLSVEGDAALYPKGIPLVGSSMTGLTAFLPYQPGRSVERLRDTAFGTFTLRVMANHRF
ncbi:MAG: hypothetical protein KIS66_04930 [Fimbriimonadaceae bacterium]|nr:hypothetical protein [Fimbriimonadaceae bacterium]